MKIETFHNRLIKLIHSYMATTEFPDCVEPAVSALLVEAAQGTIEAVALVKTTDDRIKIINLTTERFKTLLMSGLRSLASSK
jgi:hypothetical protein